jgi:uncharacterized protein HemX
MSEKDAPEQNATEPSDSPSGAESARSSTPEDKSPDAEAPASVASGADSGDDRHASSRSNAGGDGAKAPTGGRGVSVLALVVSLAALAAAGWMYFQEQAGSDAATDSQARAITALQGEVDDAIAALSGRIDRVASAQDALDDTLASGQIEARRLDALEDAQGRLQAALNELSAGQSNDDELQSTLDNQASSLQRLERRLGEIDQGLSELGREQTAIDARLDGLTETLRDQQGVQREVDRELALKLDLLEIAALMAIGQARVDLVADKGGALAAYEQASRQLADLDDRRLSQARDRLADEIAMIEAWSELEWPRMTARLAQWESQSTDWPLRDGVVSTSVTADSSDDEASDGGWLSSMGESLGKLVTVERLDGLSLTEAQVVALREQLALNLSAAGLAVQRRDLDTLSLRLRQVNRLLDQFYRVDAEPLNSIRAELGDLAALQPPAPPTGLGQAIAAIERVLESL